ncbi:hypothetical protein T4B_6852 [Trichinella pseudospiralis]|uniref:Uncharacterized protein n=1 Tax=Trichinella pseudospiralis TaxID=6337 RepID=A0A0V1GGB6_TRIPS|nr:hypothetical protein T4B_6852 [Trichinella pseudospiralis]
MTLTFDIQVALESSLTMFSTMNSNLIGAMKIHAQRTATLAIAHH